MELEARGHGQYAQLERVSVFDQVRTDWVYQRDWFVAKFEVDDTADGIAQQLDSVFGPAAQLEPLVDFAPFEEEIESCEQQLGVELAFECEAFNLRDGPHFRARGGDSCEVIRYFEVDLVTGETDCVLEHIPDNGCD